MGAEDGHKQKFGPLAKWRFGRGVGTAGHASQFQLLAAMQGAGKGGLVWERDGASRTNLSRSEGGQGEGTPKWTFVGLKDDTEITTLSPI